MAQALPKVKTRIAGLFSSQIIRLSRVLAQALACLILRIEVVWYVLNTSIVERKGIYSQVYSQIFRVCPLQRNLSKNPNIKIRQVF